MPRRKRPVLGKDYIIDPDGRAQFTREFLLNRGTCCEHECRYCPWMASAGSAAGDSCDASAQSLPVLSMKLATH